MSKKFLVLLSVLFLFSVTAYTPLSAYIIHNISDKYVHNLIHNYKQELDLRIDLLDLLIQDTAKTMKQCDQERLWFLEYEHIETRLLGYMEMNTKALCWSQGFISTETKPDAEKIKVAELTQDSGVVLLNLFKKPTLTYYRVIDDKRWLAALEHIEIRDSICIHCYEVIWQQDDSTQSPLNAEHTYLVETELKSIPAAFYFDIESIRKQYSHKITPWFIAFIFLLNGFAIVWIVASSVSKRKLKSKINYAIKKQQIQPYFQPIIDCRTQQIIAIEVLARWQIKGQVIPPSEFIDFAERSGQIDPMIISLVEQTFINRSRFHNLLKGLDFSFNVSPRQLQRPAFIKRFKKTCSKHHSHETPMALEITEREPFRNLSEAKQVLSMFTEMGIKIKLDDTGTGYGSFAYIQKLGFGIIKIDKMFIDTIETDDVKQSILDAIIEFGRTATLDMIAEGVETQAQVDYLEKHGVYAHQGYYYSKPLDFNQLVNFVQQKKGGA